MGTQQILMIILSVIIVGTAIAVGIQMFDTQLENNARQSLAAELMTQAGEVQAWFRMPHVFGGGGNGLRQNGANATTYARDAAMSVNKNLTSAQNNRNIGVFRNVHGEFTYTVQSGASTTISARQCTIVAVSDVSSNIVARAVFPLAGNGSNIVITQLDAVP